MGGGILAIILSGWEEMERARQGLRVARNIKRGNMLSSVSILFLGEGVKLLDRKAENYPFIEKYLREFQELQVNVYACQGNIKAYGLEDRVDRNLVIMDDAATVISEHIKNNFIPASF